MSGPFCLNHRDDTTSRTGPFIQQRDNVTIVIDRQGAIMFIDNTDNAEPAARLRRRDLVAAIADRTELDSDQAAAFMDELEDTIQEVAEMDGVFVDLPRAGSVEQRSAELHIVTTVLPQHVPMIRLSERVAAAAGAPAAQVDRAFAIITKLIEAAPASTAVYVPWWGYHGDEAALETLEAEQRAELLAYFREPTRPVWVLSCNPKKWDVFGYIESAGRLPDSWSISRYRDRVSVGDTVVFWLTGRRAGVYAVGIVTDEPRRDNVDASRLGDDAGSGDWEWFLPIALELDLFDAPILRSDLVTDPTFDSEPIIRTPWMANPISMSRQAIAVILGRAAR